MTVSSQQRQFTAEVRRHSASSSSSTSSASLPAAASLDSWHREVMEAIADIRLRIAAISKPEAPAIATTEDMAGSELLALKLELQALEQAISETKREIAALRQLGKPPASLATATNELDAVVHATESATECILAASERIDELVGRLRTQAADCEERAIIEEIGEQVTRIFESCNFQDITGQRITKVVGAMKFIEERVDRMIQILGGSESFAALEPVALPAPAHAAEDEAHLLCGPQLDQHKISQDDIDAFFN